MNTLTLHTHKDQTYKGLLLHVDKGSFDFKTGDIVLDWINFTLFVGQNYDKLNLEKIQHDFSFVFYLQVSKEHHMGYFSQDGKKIPREQVQEMNLRELGLFERYVVRNDMQSLADLFSYYNTHNNVTA